MAASIVLFLYLTWRFFHRRTLGRALAAAAVLGIAQTTKYTAVALFPLLALTALVYDLPRLIACLRRRRWRLLGKYLARTFLLAVLFLLVVTAIINVAFLREYSFRPLGDYEFQSGFFQTIQTWGRGIGWLRMPVPYPYVQGLDRVMDKERSGQGHGKIYMLGELRHPEGFSGYFFAAYLLKTPIATQLIFAVSLVLLIRRWSPARVRRNEQFLLVPLLVFLVYFNFFFQAQLGHRFVLMTYPMMHIISGRVGLAAQGWSFGARAVTAAGLAGIVLSTVSYYPDYLAYFNEIVWDRRTAYRYLADSNLDWGQSERSLREFMASHPEAVLEPTDLTKARSLFGSTIWSGSPKTQPVTRNKGRTAFPPPPSGTRIFCINSRVGSRIRQDPSPEPGKAKRTPGWGEKPVGSSPNQPQSVRREAESDVLRPSLNNWPSVRGLLRQQGMVKSDRVRTIDAPTTGGAEIVNLWTGQN